MLSVDASQPFSVELPSAAPAGYQWQAAALPPGVQLLDSTVVLPPNAQPGDGGMQVLRLRVPGPGRFVLTFELKRRWEAQAVETRTIEVEAR